MPNLNLKMMRLMLMGSALGTLGALVRLGGGAIAPPLTLPMDSPVQAQTSSAAQQILEAHNRYRQEVGVSPLSWSDELAQDAQVWANHLASLGGNTLQHDTSRTNQGENLWLGTAGFFSVVDAMEAWGRERQLFQPGTFPEVSTTGNWLDVGHYTQIVWQDTEQVGCAQTTAGGNNILVCRYRPPGNVIGESVY